MRTINLIALAAIAIYLLADPLALSQGASPPASTKESGATSGHAGSALQQQRMSFVEIPWAKSVNNQPGSAMRPGIETVFVVGDGKQKGLFSLVFKVPANTAIQPHSHPDDRSCFVLSGLWYFGYGTVRDETKLKALPPGSNYVEPANDPHFAGTREQDAVVECTAIGPTGTTFVNAADDPRNKK